MSNDSQLRFMIHLYDSLVTHRDPAVHLSFLHYQNPVTSLTISNLQLSFIMSCDLQFFDDIDDDTSQVVCADDELALACFSLENQAALQLPG
jgi:hypothetical protein